MRLKHLIFVRVKNPQMENINWVFEDDFLVQTEDEKYLITEDNG